jgi:hypothetical protein
LRKIAALSMISLSAFYIVSLLVLMWHYRNRPPVVVRGYDTAVTQGYILPSVLVFIGGIVLYPRPTRRRPAPLAEMPPQDGVWPPAPIPPP